MNVEYTQILCLMKNLFPNKGIKKKKETNLNTNKIHASLHSVLFWLGLPMTKFKDPAILQNFSELSPSFTFLHFT